MRMGNIFLGIGFLTLISLFSLFFIVTNTDPYNINFLSLALFYPSFFIAAAGLFVITGFFLRRLFIIKKIAPRLFKASFRQGILLSIILTSFLLLQGFKILTWWSGGLVAVIVLAIEVYWDRKK